MGCKNKQPNGSVLILRKVRHILELKKNLISVGQLDNYGHSIHFGSEEWKITKGAMVIAWGNKRSTLYMTIDPSNMVAVAEDNIDVGQLHNRLGHISQKGMRELLSKGKLPGLKTINFDMCESCVMGKQKKLSFLTGGKKLKATKLELVHIDLWGRSPVASLRSSRYYITFIDYCSRKVWIYFLKNKSEVLIFLKFGKPGLKLKLA